MIIIQPLGGLGNVLFVICNGIALSKEYNMPLLINRQYHDKRKNITNYEMFKNLRYVDQSFINKLRDLKMYREPEYKYNKIHLMRNTATRVHGYFQSYKYFQPYLSEIKNLLWANIKEIVDDAQIKINNLKGSKQLVMIHVRRGDYLELPEFHPTQPEDYYKSCLNDLTSFYKKDDLKLIVFSDDINYCRNMNVFKEFDTYYETEPDPEKAFILMTKCDHHIIANSSMSLLSTYFRDNYGKIYAPRLWFGPKGPTYDINDIVLPETKLF
jgi:hypothetical protein